jgi:peptidoglycan/xylan/chitin deacetylase (PgdA/CDA1 family)
MVSSVGRVAAIAVAWGCLVGCSGGGGGSAAPPSTVGGADRTTATTARPPALSRATPVSLPPTTDASVPILSGPRDRPAIALTFDSNMTDFMLRELDTGKVASFDNTKVIDELDAAHVPATFFLAGKWMERYPDTVRRLAADPMFELGSHSYAHLGFTAHCYSLGRIRLDRMAADVRHSLAVLRSFAPRATNLFRFPGGCFDKAALRAIEPTGVTVVQYDLPSGDAFGVDVSAMVRRVLDQAHNGAIVVMHITGGNTAPLTAQALPAIIAGLRAKGFALVTVSQLLAPLS